MRLVTPFSFVRVPWSRRVTKMLTVVSAYLEAEAEEEMTKVYAAAGS
jgi:hypothetical protein